MNRKKRDPQVYLQDILSAIARIEQYTVKGKKDFLTNTLVQDAVIRQISIIGEAAVKLPSTMKAKHPEITWKQIKGMRNIIIHDYSETDLPTVWGTVTHDLPPLKRAVKTMLKEQHKRG
jgi:uncharacterized protein with HEPN domain